MFNKVTIKDAKQAVQMFGPAQRAVALAVADCRRRGHDPRGRGRGPVHLGGRVHPLGSVGRRQDPAVQLRGHQALDRARGPRRAVGPHRGREEGQVAPSLPGWLKGISGSTKAGARQGPRRTQAAPGGPGAAGPGGSGATPGSSEHRLVEVPAPVLGPVAVSDRTRQRLTTRRPVRPCGRAFLLAARRLGDFDSGVTMRTADASRCWQKGSL